MLFGTCALLLLILAVSHGRWDLAAINAVLFVTNALVAGLNNQMIK